MFDQIFQGPMSEEDIEFLPMLSIDEDDDKFKGDIPEKVPILPLRNTVLFPGVVIPITVGRDKSIRAVKEAHKGSKYVGVLAQLDGKVEEPTENDLHSTGTLARIVKILKMPDGSNTVIIQGKTRFEVTEIVETEPYLTARGKQIVDIPATDNSEFQATISTLKDLAGRIIQISPNIPTEAGIVLKNIDNPSFLIHFISSNLNSKVKEKQRILEENNLESRAKLVLEFLDAELQMLELKNQIQSKVRGDIDKQQRDYFLHQQMKTIQEELGGDSYDQEIERLKQGAKEKKWPKHVKKTFNREIEKLQRINPAAAEYSVILNYLDLLIELPWEVYTTDSHDLQRSSKVLEKDHYGLDKVKDRILEYLAVLKLKGDLKSPILCFVGPPGVGKTSLGKSIARALKRKYVRMSLGGLHDEAEIRGHRKTYIGAMPGRIIQSLKKVKTSNPVFILDEIDKIGADFRGDPSSALLEVLDPEQNHSFYDNYIELEYDLSKVMFIATANSLSTIQPALRDRMEIIHLSGYSVEEKVEIAKRHLVGKQREAHGLKAKDVRFSGKSLVAMIERYTRESGVRDLDRKLAAVMRSRAKAVALEDKFEPLVKPEDLQQLLGNARFQKDDFQMDFPAGVAVGLAWTQTGGEILFIESVLSSGKGNLTLTGNLGDVMKESATTALSFLKAHAVTFDIEPEIFNKKNLHVHVPEGAIPKDGPSAGITMLTALASVFTGREVTKNLAMTGEITLRGKVLPVGGIKEKILAAKRSGIKNTVLCLANKKDVDEINKDYIKGMSFVYVEDMLDVLKHTLTPAKPKQKRLKVAIAEAK